MAYSQNEDGLAEHDKENPVGSPIARGYIGPETEPVLGPLPETFQPDSGSARIVSADIAACFP